MSKFSGKSDVYDHFCMSSHKETKEEMKKRVNEEIKKTNFYLCNTETKLDIKTYRDLIPYFPRIYSGGFSKEHSTMILDSESFPEKENRKLWEMKKNDIIRFKKTRKIREKCIDKTVILSLICFNKYKEKECLELIDRVEKYGSAASIEGLAGGIMNTYRKNLYDELIENDYTEEEARKISLYERDEDEN